MSGDKRLILDRD